MSLRLAGSLILLTLGVSATLSHADAAVERRLEVVAVEGIVDGPVEDAIGDALADAAGEGAEAVVLQIDSAGMIGNARARRLVEAVREAEVPVITWLGPPGAEARHGAGLLAVSGHVTAMSPGSALGPVETLDLRAAGPQRTAAAAALEVARAQAVPGALWGRAVSAEAAEGLGLVDVVAVQLPDLMQRLDGRHVVLTSESVTLHTDPEELSVRVRKPGLWGRALHAVAKPSIAYLLLLLGLVGLVFEVFHPSTGPAGLSGLGALALAAYAIAVLGGSWVGVALIVAAVASFGVDLRFEGLGVFSALGLGGLIGGSFLLFGGPYLHTSPWALAVGLVGMVGFLLGAMTRVLRDLRAIARGELEVRDAHPH